MRKIETNLERKTLSEQPELLVSWIDTNYVRQQRWFLHKSARLKELRLSDSWILKKSKKIDIICMILDIEYFDLQLKDTYYLPLMLDFEHKSTDKAIAKICGHDFVATLYDCSNSIEYYQVLMNYIWAHKKLKSINGYVEFIPIGSCTPYPIEEVSEFTGEQSNTVMFVSNKDIVKTFRRLQPGINPDLEIHLKLCSIAGSPIPKLNGYISYNGMDGTEYTLAMIERYVPNDGTAWEYVLKYLDRFFDYAKIHHHQRKVVELVHSYSMPFQKEVVQLGQVIAELHYELAQVFGYADIDKNDLSEWQHRFLDNVERVFTHSSKLPNWLLDSKDQIMRQAQKLFDIKGTGMKIRIHGDLHLGQILKTRDSFCVIDFEGEPLKPYEEVRKRSSPLRDVAGMLRSFNYAVTLMIADKKAQIATDERMRMTTDYLSRWGRCWEEIICNKFVEEYLRYTKYKGGNYLPEDELSLKLMLTLFKLEKAMYELEYEINCRPNWIDIPLQGIRQCLHDLV
ncbi:MAG TPA: hypothetical protein EYP60_05060 [bacterium (Candidatus Stahlbacteria)]|nr:hypothetical protein [Candidatus Stahlbacteria bacterium]